RTARGYAALGVMEKALGASPFLVGEQPTLADIALYAYTHVAPEGGFSLDDYPAVRRWLDRVTSVPGFVPMPFFG
ncbi:MAG: glutathione S-transferase C-terminal domain-containing protein, partial [Myxococcaceae bacterium]